MTELLIFSDLLPPLLAIGFVLPSTFRIISINRSSVATFITSLCSHCLSYSTLIGNSTTTKIDPHQIGCQKIISMDKLNKMKEIIIQSKRNQATLYNTQPESQVIFTSIVC